MNAQTIYFQNMVLFKKSLSSGEDFIIYFELNKGNDKYLSQIINSCLEVRHCKGVVFYLDSQKRHVPEKLLFLRKKIGQLLIADKDVLVEGVPSCILRSVLGGYLYMRFFYRKSKEPSFVENSVDNSKTPFLPMCTYCMDKHVCSGLGDMDMEAFNPIVKKYSISVPINNMHPFETQYALLNANHEKYMKYCYSKSSQVTYRTIYYVSNINFSSKHSYVNRFVYGCDYLSPDEYSEEFSFLREHVLYKRYIDLIALNTDIEKTSQIAYSLAQKDSILRESFYMFTPKHYGSRLLKDFDITYKYPKILDKYFIGIGVDVIKNAIEGYKLYFRATRSFLKGYLDPFGIDMSLLTYNLHYLVLRLDQEQQFVSYKVEVLIEHGDLQYFKELIEDYDYYDTQLKQQELHNIAIEIENGQISKVNIYHRHYLMKGYRDDV